MKREDFDSDMDSENLIQPLLILGSVVYPHEFEGDSMSDPFEPKEDFKDRWIRICWQGSGHGCSHTYIQGLLLEPNPETLNKMWKLSHDYVNSCLGAFGLSFNDISEYRGRIQKDFKADCQYSYRHLSEAVYPMDYDPEVLWRMTAGTFPKDPDDMINWKDALGQLYGLIGRWNIFILGENCD